MRSKRYDDFVEIGIHPNTKPWKFPETEKCPHRKCGKTFPTKKASMQHYQSVHAESAILCKKCNVPVSKQYFKIHVTKAHPGNSPAPFCDGSVRIRRQSVQTPHTPHLKRTPSQATAMRTQHTPHLKRYPARATAMRKLSYNFADDLSDDMNVDLNEDSHNADHIDGLNDSECANNIKRTNRVMEATSGQKGTYGQVLEVGDVIQIVVDVRQFEQIDCKVEGQNVVVEGRHADKNKHVNVILVSYSYAISFKFQPSDVTANFSSDGILTVTIPKETVNKVHHVPIEQASPVSQKI